MADATPKQIHSLVTYFLQQYKKKYGFDAVVNRNRSRWAVGNMLLDMSIDEAKALIDYYFETASPNGHELDWFLYNYDKLEIARSKHADDAAALARLREESKRRAEEWRRKIGNN